MANKKFSRCSKCKKDKISNGSPYCRPCGAQYQRDYQFKKQKLPNIDIKGLKFFIEGIKKNNYFVDFKDIFNIMFFYEVITNDISEFDLDDDGKVMASGKQIFKMWNKILDFYSKHT